MVPRRTKFALFPYTTLFRSGGGADLFTCGVVELNVRVQRSRCHGHGHQDSVPCGGGEGVCETGSARVYTPVTQWPRMQAPATDEIIGSLQMKAIGAGIAESVVVV